MSAAIIAALAALLGLTIGRLWDVKAEHTRWRRDQRIKSYENLASDFYRLREAMRRVSRVGPEGEQFDDLVQDCRDVGMDWNRGLISVWLHGSERVAETARQLDDAVNELFTLVRQRQLSAAEWRVERQRSEHCLESFIEAVRRDLLLPSLPVRRHWRPPELADDRPDAVTGSSS